jgi:hypothetical protein
MAETNSLGLGGVGAKQPHFWGGRYHTPILPRTKIPKRPKLTNETNKGKNMSKPKFSNSTRKLIIQLPLIILMLALTLQMLLTGCASSPHRDNSIKAILEEENELIEKIKAERSEETLRQVIEQNELLKKAESHLLMSLDEILNANKVVTTKIMKPNKQEAKNGKDEGTRD